MIVVVVVVFVVEDVWVLMVGGLKLVW